MLTKAEVSAVTAGLLGIAPGGFSSDLEQAFNTQKELADFLMTTGVFKSMYGENLTNEEFTTQFMERMLGDTLPQESFDSIVADFTAVLDAGGPRGQFVENAVSVLPIIENDDLQDARAAFIEKVAFAEAYDGSSENLDDLAGVLNGETPTEPDEPSQPGAMIGLTDGRDFITPTTADKASTDGDDTFVGLVGQNSNGDGAVSNALSTGDFLDGGAGTDKIEATLLNDNATNGANQDVSINAITQNIEQVFLSVLDENVIVDGGRMDSVEEFWSDDSDESLVLEDIRLGSKLGVTKDITFGMRDVDQQSGLSAAFESQSLINQGNVRSNAQILVEVGDSNKPADSTDPLELIELDLNFTFNGQDYSFDDIRSTDGTYEGLIQGIENALTEAGLTGLEVTAGRPLSSIQAENDTVPLLYSGATQIIITDPEGTEFTNFTSGVGAAASSKSSNPVSNIDVRDPSVATTLIESNLILDNAGRGSTAGDAVIGGMSNSNTVVEKLNLIVDRNSKIDDLATATGMESEGLNGSQDGTGKGMGDDGDYEGVMVGFQEIELTSMGANGFVSINDIQDTNTFNANSFQGSSLTIGNADELQTLNASISGNVNVTASTAAGDNVYTTGSGQDNVTVSVDGDDVDTAGESFALNTSSGNDAVTIRMSDGIDTDNGVSFNTMETLDNLSIDTGAGNDTIDLNGYGTFDINAGDGSDFIRINSTDLNGDANTGSWTIGDVSDSVNNFFDERVLYQAKLTVNFAGIEQTVDVQTDNNGRFIATQETINNAVKAAIDANPELSALLNYSDSTGNQALTINSLIGGENNLGIAIYQPQLVAGAAADDGTNVSIANGDVTALRQGLIQTGFETSSANLEDATAIANVTGGTNNWFGSVNADGTGDNATSSLLEVQHDVTSGANVADTDQGIFDDTAAGDLYLDLANGGSSDSTTGINFSSINAGAGSNDVVVMHSNDLSSNKLVIDNAFGKATVVNWHNESPDTVQDVTAMGEHALDFSAFLNNQSDASANNNTDSAVHINTTVNLVSSASSFGAAVSPGVNNTNGAAANSVNVIRFAENGTANQTFENLNAQTLVAALNDTDGSGNSDFGNLNGALLDPTVTATLVGSEQDHIVMIENGNNEGEYKVFHLTSTLNTGKTATTTTAAGGANLFDTTAVELGTLDFGASINFNVVGNTGYENYVAALEDALDNNQTTFTYQDASGADVTVDLTTGGQTPNPDTDFTVQEYKDATDAPTTYTIADTLSEIISANADSTVGGDLDILVNAQSLAIEDDTSTLDGEVFTLANAVASNDPATGTSGNAIDFTDDAATLTAADVQALSTGSIALTDADAITVTGVTDYTSLNAANSALNDTADIIEVDDGSTVAFAAAADYNGVVSTVQAETDGTGADAVATVAVSGGDSLTGDVDLATTFNVATLADGESATVASFAMGDAIDTGLTGLAEQTGSLATDSNVEYTIGNDGTNTTITYELTDDGSATTTASVVLTGVALTDADVSVDQGVITYDIV